MRGTIHTVTAEDASTIRPLVQTVMDRSLVGARDRALEGSDIETVAAAGRELTTAEPLTFAALGDRLAQRWPAVPPRDLAMAVRAKVPLVQVPPRGIWGKSGPAAHMPLDQWVETKERRRRQASLTVDELVLRYLGAFGPASVADVQAWSGLTGLAEVIDRLGKRLRTFAADDGRMLVDLPDAPRPEPDTPAPVRLLPEFDNIVLSHEDRTRIAPGDYRSWLLTKNGIIPATVLVDGFVRGTWRTVRARTHTTIEVTPMRKLSKRHAASVTAEARRLLAVIAPEIGSEEREVEIKPPP